MWLGGCIDHSASETGTISQTWSLFINLSSAGEAEGLKEMGSIFLSWRRALAGVGASLALHILIVDALGKQLLKAKGPCASGPLNPCAHLGQWHSHQELLCQRFSRVEVDL